MKRILTALVCIISLTIVLGTFVSFAKDTNTLEWELDGTTLVIRGNGSTGKYAQNGSDKWPWKAHNSSITKVEIEEGITDISYMLFKDLTALKSVSLPSTLTVIGNHAFENCYSLESIEIPSSVTTIGDYSFIRCESLKSVKLNEGLESIGYNAFNGCTSLTDITFPKSLTDLNTNALPTTPLYEDPENWEDGALYKDGILISAKDINVTEYTVKEGTRMISSGVFSGNSKLEKVNIPDSVTIIGNSAFYACTSIKTLDLPDSITVILPSAFAECSSLETIKLPDKLEYLRGHAFEECTALTEIRFPETVKAIDYGVCRKCTSLKAAYLPEEVEYISSYVFEGCYELETVKMPKKAGYYISQDAFGSCYKLKNITLPENITGILSYAFYGCDFTVLDIPDTVTEIDERTFAYCDRLSKLSLPESLETIGYEAFVGCKALTELELPKSLKSIDDMAFENCTSLKSITIYDSVTDLGYGVFRNCPELTVKCEPDGYVHEYLMKNSIPYEFIKHCEHSFTTYITDKKTNCNDNITKTAICDKGCGQTSTITIDGTGEEHGDAVWVVTKKPSYISEGISSLKCPKCSYAFETKVIPMLIYNGFPDVPKNSWYAEGVDYSFNKGYVVGDENGKFLPNAKLTREQFVVILARIENASPEKLPTSVFTDVNPSSWYAPAVEWASGMGYVKGTGESTFGVGRYISRQELAVLMYRIAEAKGITDGSADLSDYEDRDNIATWAKKEVSWAVYAGLFSSTHTTRNIISPEMSVTRAQIAKILMCYDSYLERS